MGWNPLKDLDSAFGSPLGIANAADAKKANLANLKKIGGLYDKSHAQLGQDYYRALGTQKRATAELRTGVNRGRMNIATIGNTTRQGVLDRARTGLDTELVGQEGRGIYSQALAASARRSSSYDVNSALGAVDEAIQRLASQYELQGAGAIASSLGQESGILQALAQARKGSTQGYMDILGGVQHTAAPGWAADLLKGIGALS